VLKNLPKDCTFSAVTANQYHDELIRDDFINGLSSPSIRQRLLESDGLDITRAYELTDSLDRAHRQPSSMEQPHASPLVASAPQYSKKETNITDTFVCDTPDITTTPDMASEAESCSLAVSTSKKQRTKDKLSCYFCGRSPHNRNSCPSREATCFRCGKHGHFSKVC